MKYPKIFHLLFVFKFVECDDVNPYISGGNFVSYNQYPHSVFIDVPCEQRSICCGSVLNQNIILTAAHCFDFCDQLTVQFVVRYGHEDIRRMKTSTSNKYLVHRHYDESHVINDVSLMVTTNPMSMKSQVRRVILMENPSLPKYAYVAGWGRDEEGVTQTILKHTFVQIQPDHICKEILGRQLHQGIMCAGPITGTGTALSGDSGAALMIDNFVQIGVVSYKLPRYSLVAYTNVSYYLAWIKRNAKYLYCFVNLK